MILSGLLEVLDRQAFQIVNAFFDSFDTLLHSLIGLFFKFLVFSFQDVTAIPQFLT